MNAMWKEIGKAVLANVLIPTAVQVGSHVAKVWADKLAKDNKIVIRLNVQQENV